MMRLYADATWPYAWRVRMFLAEKGLDVELRAAIDSPPQWFLEPSPLAATPVLEFDDGRRLCEPVSLCAYIDEIHPDPPLLGVDHKDRAIVRQWQRRTDWRLFRFAFEAVVALESTDAVAGTGELLKVPAWGTIAMKLAQSYLGILDAELATRDFIAGPRFTITDITAFCAIRLGARIGFGPCPEQVHLRAWQERVASRPSAALAVDFCSSTDRIDDGGFRPSGARVARGLEER